MALPCCRSVPVQRVSKLCVDAFKTDYLKKGVPVVIEGGLEDWPARKWTIAELYDRVGQNPVFVRSNTNSEEYRLGKEYRIRQSTFQKYIDDIRAANKRARNSYLAVQNIKKAFPQLQEEAPVPAYVGKVHAGPFLWLAMKGHYEYCHFDPDDGLLIMIQGVKQVRLFGCDLEPMYPNLLGSQGRTVQSLVNCDYPDLDTQPLFKEATCHYCLLNPGEMLYIPAFWWHQVTSLETALSMNIFWGDAGTNTFLTKVMDPPYWPAFSHWLLNVIEQNRSYEAFKPLLGRLPESLYNFLITQWHEAATPEQLEKLVKLIMGYLKMDTLPETSNIGKNPPKLQIRGLLWRQERPNSKVTSTN